MAAGTIRNEILTSRNSRVYKLTFDAVPDPGQDEPGLALVPGEGGQDVLEPVQVDGVEGVLHVGAHHVDPATAEMTPTRQWQQSQPIH